MDSNFITLKKNLDVSDKAGNILSFVNQRIVMGPSWHIAMETGWRSEVHGLESWPSSQPLTLGCRKIQKNPLHLQ